MTTDLESLKSFSGLILTLSFGYLLLSYNEYTDLSYTMI